MPGTSVDGVASGDGSALRGADVSLGTPSSAFMLATSNCGLSAGSSRGRREYIRVCQVVQSRCCSLEDQALCLVDPVPRVADFPLRLVQHGVRLHQQMRRKPALDVVLANGVSAMA